MLLLVPVLMGCASCVSLVTSRGQSWEMIQSVGGLRVDNPVTHADGTVSLPVVCNVSGLDTITVKPTMLNSALVVRKIAVRCRQDRIQIQVVTCVADNTHASVSTGASLGRMKPGPYLVEYLNPDGTTVRLREIEIREPNTQSQHRLTPQGERHPGPARGTKDP